MAAAGRSRPGHSFCNHEDSVRPAFASQQAQGASKLTGRYYTLEHLGGLALTPCFPPALLLAAPAG